MWEDEVKYIHIPAGSMALDTLFDVLKMVCQ